MRDERDISLGVFPAVRGSPAPDWCGREVGGVSGYKIWEWVGSGLVRAGWFVSI